MKVFLSHKMDGLTRDEVMSIRAKALIYLTSKYGEIDLIDNYHHYNVPDDAGRLWHLGTSITQIEEADAVYFCDGYTDSNGCQVEKLVCELYNVKVLK